MDWDEKDEWEEDFSPRDSEGRLHGTNYSFYETGGVCEKTNWHHGESEGLQEWFYANGKPQKRCTHKNGLRCGRHTEWYVDGTKKIDCFYENNECIAIFDINPASKGHTLVIPKEHYPILPLIPPDTFKSLVKTIKGISQSMRDGILCQGTTVFIANGGVAGQQSQHFLVHVIPRENEMDIQSLDIPKKEVSDEEVEKIFNPLKQNLPMMMKNHFIRMGQKPASEGVTQPQPTPQPTQNQHSAGGGR